MPDEQDNFAAVLKAHFDAQERREIRIDALPAPLYCPPLTAEDLLALRRAHDENDPGKQARLFGRFIAAKLRTADDKLAFRSFKDSATGKMLSPSEVLAKYAGADVVLELIGAISDAQPGADADELEKKDEP